MSATFHEIIGLIHIRDNVWVVLVVLWLSHYENTMKKTFYVCHVLERKAQGTQHLHYNSTLVFGDYCKT